MMAVSLALFIFHSCIYPSSRAILTNKRNFFTGLRFEVEQASRGLSAIVELLVHFLSYRDTAMDMATGLLRVFGPLIHRIFNTGWNTIGTVKQMVLDNFHNIVDSKVQGTLEAAFNLRLDNQQSRIEHSINNQSWLRK